MGRPSILLAIALAAALPERVMGAELPPTSVATPAVDARARREAAIERFSEEAEKELVTTRADTEDLSPKLKTWLSTSTTIEGQWDSHYWHDGPHLTIRKTGDNAYRVTHYARGDLFSFKLERTATFHAGVLTLDKPVKEYLPVKPYTRFYLLNTPRGIRFASQALVRDKIVGKKTVDWDFLENEYLLSLRTVQPKK